ncbi:ankyrin repeat-containing domain protein [Haematococcus lacustris]
MSSDRKSYKLQIYEAAEASDEELLEKLLTALQHQQGVVERKLLEYRDKDGCTPLIVAAANNNLNCVRLLLEHGAKVNAMSAGEEGGTAFHHAARMGGEYAAVCKLLYSKGANPFLADCKDRTPLDEAILAGQPAAEDFGASTSTSTGILNQARKLHERRAQEAMQSGWREFVETILARAPLLQYRAAILVGVLDADPDPDLAPDLALPHVTGPDPDLDADPNFNLLSTCRALGLVVGKGQGKGKLPFSAQAGVPAVSGYPCCSRLV